MASLAAAQLGLVELNALHDDPEQPQQPSPSPCRTHAVPLTLDSRPRQQEPRAENGVRRVRPPQAPTEGSQEPFFTILGPCIAAYSLAQAEGEDPSLVRFGPT